MDFTTLIDVESLRARSGTPATLLFDCRFDLAAPTAGREAYLRGHIPGARYLDLNRDLSAPVSKTSGRHPLPDPEALAALLKASGLGPDTQAVVYDRVEWLVRRKGVVAAALDRPSQSCGPRRRYERVAPRGGRLGIRRALSRGRGPMRASPDRSRRARRRRRAGRSRSGYRHRGADRGARQPQDAARRCARSGALRRGGRADRSGRGTRAAGAVNHPFTANLRPDGRFLAPAELRGAGWSGSAAAAPADVIAMCGSGVTACHNLLALGAAGLPGAKLYAGSWSEWIRDPARPVATGCMSDARCGERRAPPRRQCCAIRHLHAAPICYRARHMNTRQELPANHAWKIEESLDLYQVEAWGKGYFSINADGHVVIRPSMDAAREIDLYEVVQGLKARDLHTPVVIRFSDILAHRLRHLADAFGTAIVENDYQNRYAAVFPIKVNQQRLVVEEVYRYGKEFGFGLEVGSKPELLAVMSITEDAPDRIVVCNGFKDDSYIEAVILATKLGRTIIPVVENFEEIHLILKHAEHYGVRPKIGVRVKLASEGAGRWRESAGEKSKFGLFISEILDLYALLKERNMLDCLQLVHCHPGSQLQDIRRVKDAINELAHVYAELKIMGAGLQVHRHRRRLGRRLRRQRHQLRILDELHAERVRERRGVPHQERLRRARRAAPDDRERIRTRHRRASQPAGVRHPGRLQAGPIQGLRAAGGGLPRPARSCRSRCAICSTATARSTSGAWSSATTTRCRPANRRCRCSIWAT